MNARTAVVDDLEALFDQVSAEREAALAVAEAAAPAPGAEPPDAPPESERGSTDEQMFRRVGALTRTLHDALRELGYDRHLERAAESLPDARDRLGYIASLTGQAAEKVLTAVEQGQSLQQEVGAGAALLGARWEALHRGEVSLAGFRELAGATRDYLAVVPRHSAAMESHLHAIMMAQDFHDLTGQVITKVVDIARTLESSLLALLVETHGSAGPKHEPFLSGPQHKPGERTDIVHNQAQVDDLLESLGF
jgi:chemotaxis protein CheZ